jgi:Ca2+-binding RTX toxin-like protein
MARVTGGSGGPLDLSLINLGNLLGYTPIVDTTTQLLLTNGVERVDFFGNGFAIDALGNVYGTISAIQSSLYGQPWLTVTGIAIPAADMIYWIYFDLTDVALQTVLSGGDEIIGSGYADYVEGYGGHDRISGLGGNDLLGGGDGNDVIDGGSGADMMYGDLGNDTFVVDQAGDFVIEGAGAGTDRVLSYVSFALPDNVEHLTVFSTGTGVTGNDLANTLTGSDVNNVIDGRGGNDVIYARGGNDTVLGRAGNDIVYGGAGNDAIAGWDGSDTLLGEDGADIVFGGTGNDRIVGGFGNDILMGEDGQQSGTGDDVIRAGWGSDQVNGGFGNDQLFGDGGADVITGGAGNDLISGGHGADIMNGGDGRDLFSYSALADFFGPGSGPDVIVGITTMQGVHDGFDLRALFNSLGAPGSTAGDLRALGWLRVIQSGVDALLQIDSDGGSDGFATVARLMNVTAADVGDYMILV